MPKKTTRKPAKKTRKPAVISFLPVALTPAQIVKIVRAGHAGKGTTITLTRAQLGVNSPTSVMIKNPTAGVNKISKTQVGGFLPFLGPLVGLIKSIF